MSLQNSYFTLNGGTWQNEKDPYMWVVSMSCPDFCSVELVRLEVPVLVIRHTMGGHQRFRGTYRVRPGNWRCFRLNSEQTTRCHNSGDHRVNVRMISVFTIRGASLGFKCIFHLILKWIFYTLWNPVSLVIRDAVTTIFHSLFILLYSYCDMTPESRNSGTRADVSC
jgi:hypothetical protein